MGLEKYQPSSEEIKRVEDTMSDEQKKLSETRAEGYDIAESAHKQAPQEKNPAEPTIERHGSSYKVISPEQPYRESATVNNIDIIAHWDPSYGDYVLYFPQNRNVDEGVIRVSQRPEEAKKAFDFACGIARFEHDGSKIFKRVEDFSQALTYDLEKEDEDR